MDIDSALPTMKITDPVRKPQDIVLKSSTNSKQRNKENEQQDQPDNNKQFSVEEMLDQSKILLEIEIMEESIKSNTQNEIILSTENPFFKRASEGNASTQSMELEESTTNYDSQIIPATEVK